MNIRLSIENYFVDLQDIGKVNVICGANSSGKSTVLNSLESGPQLGFPLSDLFNRENLLAELAPFFTPAPGESPTFVGPAKSAVAEQLLADSSVVLYQDELQGYIQTLRNRAAPWKNAVQFSDDGFHQWLLQRYQPIPMRRLVTPKRQLHTHTVFTAARQQPGIGHEVIHGLFQAQNNRIDNSEQAQLAKFESAFQEITGGIRYAIHLSDGSISLYFSFMGGELMHADKCGLGLQDILVILYNAIFDPSPLLLIEELENHLHPVWQRAVARYLRSETDKRVLLSTHSSVLLDHGLVDEVYLAQFQDSRVSISKVNAKVNALRALGYVRSDYVSAKVLAILEGPGDQAVVEHFLGVRHANALGRIAYQFFGGDNCGHLRLSHLREAFGHVLAFADSEIDKGSRRMRRKLKKLCDDDGVPCTLSSKPNLEFYFPMSAYRSVFPSVGFPETWSTDEPVSSQTTARVKEKTLELARATDWEDIKDTDLGQFITRIAELAVASD